MATLLQPYQSLMRPLLVDTDAYHDLLSSGTGRGLGTLANSVFTKLQDQVA